MFCPVCKAEYREGYTHCADCDVDLVLSLPQEPEYGEHDAFVSLWAGGPGHMMAQIRKTLDAGRIPFRVIEYKDTLFNVNYRAPYEIAVPPSQLEKAREALGWNASEESDSAPLPSTEDSDDDVRYELPEEEGADAATRAVDPDHWNPEDATEIIWAGDDHDGAEMIITSLSENGIHWRIGGELDEDSEMDGDSAPVANPHADQHTEIFVLPADVDRAKEIIREIAGSEPL
jgi:hypothetical protein